MSAKTPLASVALLAATACVLTGCSKAASKSASRRRSDAGRARQRRRRRGAAALRLGGRGQGNGRRDSVATSRRLEAVQGDQAGGRAGADEGHARARVIDPLECDFAGGTLKVNITARRHRAHSNTPCRRVTDPATQSAASVTQAFWFAPVEGHTTPWLESYKGSVACEVSPAEPADAAIPSDRRRTPDNRPGPTPAPTRPRKASLCNDVFAAGS